MRKKFVFVHQKYSRGLFIGKTGVCPYCRGRNFESRKGGGFLSRLFSGAWWCNGCRRPFRKPVIVKVHRM